MSTSHQTSSLKVIKVIHHFFTYILLCHPLFITDNLSYHFSQKHRPMFDPYECQPSTSKSTSTILKRRSRQSDSSVISLSDNDDIAPHDSDGCYRKRAISLPRIKKVRSPYAARRQCDPPYAPKANLRL